MRRHPHTELFVHLVWATWNRAPLITPDVRDRIYPMMQRKAADLRAEVIAIGGVEDHVHVLARYRPTLAIADLVQQMKGASSFLASQVMGRRFKWQGAYGAFSLSRSGVRTVRDYVLNQDAHHRGNTTYAVLEATREQVRG
jgi:REP element-mobilizing transposase RayT